MKATKGIDLELRAHRLSWHLGYFPRRRIFLYSDEGNPITDIDVIGIRFDSTYSSNYLLIETKSEKGFASILKIKGLLAYYNSNTAYIIRPNITPDIMRFAESLSISAFHTSRLDEIEEELGINEEDWSYSYSPDNDYTVNHYVELLKENGYNTELDLVNLFWEERDSFSIIKKIISATSKLYVDYNKNNGELKQALKYLNLELMVIFITSLMRCCGELYNYPTHQRKVFFLERLVSGKLSYMEKEDLMDKFYSFLKNYSKSIGVKLELKRRDLSLVPSYGNELYDLINIFIEQSKSVDKFALFLDVLLYKSLNDEKIIKKEISKFFSIDEKIYETWKKMVNSSVLVLYGQVPDFIILE